jgi:hypothetical protein
MMLPTITNSNDKQKNFEMVLSLFYLILEMSKNLKKIVSLTFILKNIGNQVATMSNVKSCISCYILSIHKILFLGPS